MLNEPGARECVDRCVRIRQVRRAGCPDKQMRGQSFSRTRQLPDQIVRNPASEAVAVEGVREIEAVVQNRGERLYKSFHSSKRRFPQAFFAARQMYGDHFDTSG
jgi:hypothetical protein